MRRIWLACSVSLCLTGTLAAPASARDRLLFIGTQASAAGEGIVAARLDDRTGRLQAIGVVAELKRPIWLLRAPKRPVLWSVADAGAPDTPPAGRVHAFAVDRRTGDLKPLNDGATGGRGPTYLALDRTGRALFVAHYGGGQVAALPVSPDGRVDAPSAVVQNTGSGPSRRQTGPHAHAAVVDPTGRFVLVPDLGADRVFVYRYDTKTRSLSPAAIPVLTMPPGSGPRHLVFAPDGRHAYLVTELDAAITLFDWNAARGTLTPRAGILLESAPAGGTASASEIAISGNGRTLYVGNRGTGRIEVFAVLPGDGALRRKQAISSGGKTPWHFAIDPSGRWLVVSNLGSDQLAVLPIAHRSGLLGAPVSTLAVTKPVVVAFD